MCLSSFAAYTCTGLTDRKRGRRELFLLLQRSGEIRLACGLRIFTPDQSGAKCLCFLVYALTSRRTLIFRIANTFTRKTARICVLLVRLGAGFVGTETLGTRSIRIQTTRGSDCTSTTRKMRNSYRRMSCFARTRSQTVKSICHLTSRYYFTARRDLNSAETTNTCGGVDR